MATGDHWRSLGTPGGHIEIAAYNPGWRRAFEAETAAILEACRPRVVEVHHVGSTAVPGLAAKPVLDMLPVAAGPAEALAAAPRMTALGYRYRGENGISGRFYFEKAVDGRTVAHVHMFPLGHPAIRTHLAFRDYLRAHPDAARDYERLKRDLAMKHRNDREAYTDARPPSSRASSLLRCVSSSPALKPFGGNCCSFLLTTPISLLNRRPGMSCPSAHCSSFAVLSRSFPAHSSSFLFTPSTAAEGRGAGCLPA